MAGGTCPSYPSFRARPNRDVRRQFTPRKESEKPAIGRLRIVVFLDVRSGAIGGIECGGEVLGFLLGEFVCRAIIAYTHEAGECVTGSTSDADLYRLRVTGREPDAWCGALGGEGRPKIKRVRVNVLDVLARQRRAGRKSRQRSLRCEPRGTRVGGRDANAETLTRRKPVAP